MKITKEWLEKQGDDGKGRFECRKNRPCDPKIGKRWYHPAAKCIIDGDYFDTYKCPFCDIIFTVTLAE